MMTVSEIIDKIMVLSPKEPGMIVLTGGEPTVHDLTALLEALKHLNLFVAIETNGTNPVKAKYNALIDWVSCSPKPMNDYKINPGVIPSELKYVVDDVFTPEVIPTTYREQIPIWLQPEGYHMQESAQKAFEYVLEYTFLQLGIQMHKIFELK
jgi:organic radical activating enzyme